MADLDEFEAEARAYDSKGVPGWARGFARRALAMAATIRAKDAEIERMRKADEIGNRECHQLQDEHGELEGDYERLAAGNAALRYRAEEAERGRDEARDRWTAAMKLCAETDEKRAKAEADHRAAALRAETWANEFGKERAVSGKLREALEGAAIHPNTWGGYVCVVCDARAHEPEYLAHAPSCLLSPEAGAGDGWKPISDYSGSGVIQRWHRVWKCPVAVEPNGGRMPGYPDWITATKDQSWPEEAFTPHFQPIPHAPKEKSDAEV